MSKHTPGPWRVSGLDTVVGASGNVVAECVGYSMAATDPSQRLQGGREANARLIAAAPDLLAALESCVTEPGAACFRDDDRDMLVRRLRAINEAARAAIAAARGES